MFFEKLKSGLSKTKQAFADSVNNVFSVFTKVDDELLDELEEILIMSDVGMKTSEEIIERLRSKIKKNRITEPEKVKEALKEVLVEILEDAPENNVVDSDVIVVVGVNGVGKTTTLGKLSNYFVKKGKSVIACAADTFRAAAVEQLEIWCERSNIDLVKRPDGTDPASVVFDAVKVAQEKKSDILICDTAGRLHNKKNLMAELEKIGRVVDRELPGADKEILLVLDASTGQNAVSQAKLFGEVADITGIVLTKLDGTAKGGIVVSISKEQQIPVKFIGVGEGIDDLQEFNAPDFAKALFEE